MLRNQIVAVQLLMRCRPIYQEKLYGIHQVTTQMIISIIYKNLLQIDNWTGRCYPE